MLKKKKEIKDPNEIKPKWYKRGDTIVNGLIIAIVSFSLYTNFSNNQKVVDIHRLNGMTEKEIKALGDKPHIIANGKCEKGKFICGNNSNEPDQEIIPVPVDIKEKGYITINANAEGKFDSSLKKGNLGKVIVKICIDQIEYRKDVSAFQNCKNQHMTMPLAASVTFGKELDPGEYMITVIGIFEGCIVVPRTAMDFKVERLLGTQPERVKTTEAK